MTVIRVIPAMSVGSPDYRLLRPGRSGHSIATCRDSFADRTRLWIVLEGTEDASRTRRSTVAAVHPVGSNGVGVELAVVAVEPDTSVHLAEEALDFLGFA